MARRISLLREGYRSIAGSTRVVLVAPELAPRLARMCPNGRDDAERALRILAELPDMSLGHGPYRVVEAVGWLFFCLPERPNDDRLAVYDMLPAAQLRNELEQQDHHHHYDQEPVRAAVGGRWRQAGVERKRGSSRGVDD